MKPLCYLLLASILFTASLWLWHPEDVDSRRELKAGMIIYISKYVYISNPHIDGGRNR